MNDKGYKGFNYPLKGIVTRDDDPAGLGRIQVCIPSYHGEKDDNKIGSGNELGEYPWAQISTIIFNDVVESGSTGEEEVQEEESGGFLKKLFNGVKSKVTQIADSAMSRLKSFFSSGGKSVAIIPPDVGDVVWLVFEGGDIRCPVYMGSLNSIINAKDEVQVEFNTLDGDGSFSNIDGSYGNNYQLAGGSISLYIEDIMFPNRSYGYIRTGSTPTAVGLLPWEAKTGAMNTLIKEIYNSNPSGYKSILANPSYTKIDHTKSFKNQTVVQNSTFYNSLYAIINSAFGRQTQDNLFASEISKLISVAQNTGINDPTAIIMFADMYYFAGSGASSVAKGTDLSLDQLYEASKSIKGYDGSRVYTAIKQYISEGKFVKTDNTSLIGSAGSDATMKWPVPSSRNVTRGFSNSHPGLEISAKSGSLVIASHNGTVRLGSSTSRGTYVQINGSNSIYTVYAHLASTRVSNGSAVKAGDTIGYVGISGESNSGYNCYFQVYKNNTADNPYKYIESASSISTGAGASSASASEVWGLLKKQGLSNYACAGIIGNMEAESNVESVRCQGDFSSSRSTSKQYTAAVDNGSKSCSAFANDGVGYGLCQWTDSGRKTGLYNFAKSKGASIGNTSLQILWLMNELKGGYSDVYALLQSATTVRAASDAFLTKFEKPQDYWTESMQSYRASLCQSYYNSYAK